MLLGFGLVWLPGCWAFMCYVYRSRALRLQVCRVRGLTCRVFGSGIQILEHASRLNVLCLKSRSSGYY